MLGKDPFELMKEMNKNMEKLTREIWNRSMEVGFEFKQKPSMDVIEKKDETVIKMDIPGTRKEDINIKVRDSVLEVSAKRREEKKKEKEDFYKRERRYTGYKRTVGLPEGSKIDEIEAEYKNGVLKVKVPGKEKEKEAKKVRVK